MFKCNQGDNGGGNGGSRLAVSLSEAQMTEDSVEKSVEVVT